MSLKVNIEKYFKPDVYLDDVVRTSSTVGHLKNDGTVDTTNYATSASVSAITDGQSIDSFSDVETALVSKAENSVVGTVESGTTASQAYAVGEHFIRNDKFCTAIAAIASGAILTLNTNYVEGTIAEAINWKFVNYADGSTKISLPSGWTAIRIVSQFDKFYNGTLEITRDELDRIFSFIGHSEYYPSAGFYSDNDNVRICYKVTASLAGIEEVRAARGYTAANFRTWVYYK